MARPSIALRRRPLRRGLSAGVVARRHARRVLGVAQGRLSRHQGRRARVGPGDRRHARPRDRHGTGVVGRWHDDLLRQRSHRHLEQSTPTTCATTRRGRSRTSSAARSPAGHRPTARAWRTRNTVAAGGYDVYEIPLDRSTWLPARDFLDDKPPPVVIADNEAWVSQPRPYRAIEDTRAASLDRHARRRVAHREHPDQRHRRGRPAQLRAVGRRRSRARRDRHRCVVFVRRRAAGAQRRGRARTLVTRGGLHIDGVNTDFTEEDWAGTLALGIPLESRPSASWSLSFEYDVDWYRAADGADDPDRSEPARARPAADELRRSWHRDAPGIFRACARRRSGSGRRPASTRRSRCASTIPTSARRIATSRRATRSTSINGCGASRR